MTSVRRGWLWIGAWAAIIAVASYALGVRTQIGSDLRLFLPHPENPAERILLEQLKDGPGTRLLLLALSGADSVQLAAASAQLSDALRGQRAFTQVENGTFHESPRLQQLAFTHRYLLTPQAQACACDAQSLHAALQAQLVELGSPASALTQALSLRDPTGALPAIIDRWQGERQPQLIEGVWFDAAGQRALLLVQTAAPGFDADMQDAARSAIRQALHRVDPTERIHLDITGPGAFTDLLAQAVRDDVTRLGMTEGIFSLLFLLWVLRSPRHVALGTLTLATAGVAALLGVTLLYPQVHGITLAFGFTLLGVAMDYPVHLMLHLRRDQPGGVTLQHVWPTLRLSIITTCIAYLALVFAGFAGLAQLGTFTVCGLLATALAIRWWLPPLVNPAASRSMPPWVTQLHRVPRISWLPWALMPLATLALLLSPRALWNNELSSLTPVPQALQALDADLRNELGAPDLRYALALRADHIEGALQHDEALRGQLEQLVQQGIVAGYQSPSQLLPSVQRQTQRRAQLPDEARLRAALHQASASLPFRAGVFNEFITDVNLSRALQPLTPHDFDGTPIAARLSATLFNTDREAVALITLSGVNDAARLTQWAQRLGSTVLLLDLKQIPERLVARFRHHALLALGIALLLIAILMMAQLSARAAVAVLSPVLATLLTEVALLNWAGVSLTLFHIVSLLLVGGLCFDYGLFFNRSTANDEESLRTRFAVMACWLSTAGAFALLMISSIPVLRAIGSTVTLGVSLGFMIALLARGAARQ